MPFVEVFAPQGSVAADRQVELGNRLVTEVLRAGGAPDTGVAPWPVWHDVSYWAVGGQPTNARELADYVVRISVPAASMTDETRADVVARVTKVLADHPSGRRRRTPTAWVQFIETDDTAGLRDPVVRFAEYAGL
jgi:hypothetical protein